MLTRVPRNIQPAGDQERKTPVNAPAVLNRRAEGRLAIQGLPPALHPEARVFESAVPTRFTSTSIDFRTRRLKRHTLRCRRPRDHRPGGAVRAELAKRELSAVGLTIFRNRICFIDGKRGHHDVAWP